MSRDVLLRSSGVVCVATEAGILLVMDERTPRAAGRRDPTLFAWAPAVAWAGLIFILSAQPDLRFLPDSGLDFIVRKVGHMGVFGIWTLLVWRAFAITTAWTRPWAWALVLTVLYAASDELHQGLVAGRYLSGVDVGIDALGALVAIAVVRLYLSHGVKRG